MRRINRAEDKEAAISALIKDEDSTAPAIFPTKWQLLTFAAMLGYRNDRKEPLNTISSGKGIDAETFMKDPCFEGVLNLFSLMEDEDERLLTSDKENDDRKVTLFEEYANGGLAIIKEQLETSNYSLESVITLIAEELHRGPALDEELGTIQI
jgi:dnd system-associated protein 4